MPTCKLGTLSWWVWSDWCLYLKVARALSDWPLPFLIEVLVALLQAYIYDAFCTLFRLWPKMWASLPNILQWVWIMIAQFNFKTMEIPVMVGAGLVVIGVGTGIGRIGGSAMDQNVSPKLRKNSNSDVDCRRLDWRNCQGTICSKLNHLEQSCTVGGSFVWLNKDIKTWKLIEEFRSAFFSGKLCFQACLFC